MDIQSLTSSLGADLVSQVATYLREQPGMDDNDMSLPDSPADGGESTPQTTFEKQRAALQTYLDSVPYDCESIDHMQERLEGIVGKIVICAQSKNWLTVTTWDSMLQW